MCLELAWLEHSTLCTLEMLGLQVGYIFADSQTWRLDVQVSGPEREVGSGGRGMAHHIVPSGPRKGVGVLFGHRVKFYCGQSQIRKYREFFKCVKAGGLGQGSGLGAWRWQRLDLARPPKLPQGVGTFAQGH